MKLNKKLLVIVGVLGVLSVGAIPIKTFQENEALPPALDLSEVKKVSSLSKMSQVKWYEENEKWGNCLKTIETVNHKSSLSLWISMMHLKCLENVYQVQPNKSVQSLVQSFKQIEPHKDAIKLSPFKGHKERLVRVFLDLAEKSLNRGRDVFDELIDRNHDLVDLFSEKQRARFYWIMGEMAWLRQKNDLAKSNFLRSYHFSPSQKVLNRLKALKADGSLRLGKYQKGVGLNNQEKKDWKKFKTAANRGQTINVVRQGISFLEKYPGSPKREEIRSRIALYFKRLLYRSDRRYKAQKETYESYMLEAPAADLYEWSDIAYQRGYYKSSLKLSAKAAKKWKGKAEAAKALIIAARSSYYLSERSDCENYLDQLIQKHSGQVESFEAQYLLGLLHYRNGSYQKVVRVYDQFLLSQGSDKWELQVRYWLWRAIKKLKSPRAAEMAQVILREFPLTYYGLIVRMDSKGNLQNIFQNEKVPVSSSYWWTLHNNHRWERVKELLKIGWLDEAEREIDLLPDPQQAPEYIVRAKIWLSALRTRRSMRDYSKAIDKDPRFLTKDLLKMSFPKKFEKEVLLAEKEFSVSDELIWAIMRQESAFAPRAVSPSRAYGLMQMLRPTMNETARWLKAKNYRHKRDRFNPQMNVRFGTHFLSRMIRKYKGVVPLAIASYNVGPGNLDRWIRQREDLKSWKTFGRHLDEDMWMDELPWAETSFYVKAVMRNFLLYRIIHGEYDLLESPSWSGAQDFYTVPENS